MEPVSVPDGVSVERDGPHVAVVRLDRPPVNALDRRAQRALAAAFQELSEDLDVRSVVLTGAGRCFCAGADLAEEQALAPDEVGDLLGDISAMLAAVLQARMPVVAAVNGPAHGGGLELALACDVRLGSTAASFGAAGVNVGLVANVGGLVDTVGRARAAHLLLSGLPCDAPTALDWGLVTLLTPPEDLLDAALAYARRVASRAPLAVEATRSMLRSATDLSGTELLRLQRQEFARLFGTRDAAEAMAAFFERRDGDYRRR